ncbi:MAG TPA: hypothetical protein VNE63_19630 [Candidatus Acidoferrales bacterium]|nr:hypothetical protein [Candidatus Acidoferrales bacterium]
MDKVEDCRVILSNLGLPRAQCTRIAAYTVLALADLTKFSPWSAAKRRSLRIHDILVFVKREYQKTYAENTRETIRRQVLHQLEQASVADRNSDDPMLPTNSPRTHYAISEAALRVLRTFGTHRFEEEAHNFQLSKGSLWKIYQAGRQKHLIPVRLPSGKKIQFSPGKHNNSAGGSDK